MRIIAAEFLVCFSVRWELVHVSICRPCRQKSLQGDPKLTRTRETAAFPSEQQHDWLQNQAKAEFRCFGTYQYFRTASRNPGTSCWGGQTLAPAMAPSFFRFSSFSLDVNSSQPNSKPSCMSPAFSGSLLLLRRELQPLKFGVERISNCSMIQFYTSTEIARLTFIFSLSGREKNELEAASASPITCSGIPWFSTKKFQLQCNGY